MRRVAFFDIDGTLMTGGPVKNAFCGAMIDTFGTVGNVEEVSFGGKTDPQIARELLSGIGYKIDLIEERFPSLWHSYTERLADELTQCPMQVLPGVHDLLNALKRVDDIGVGLLTGNIALGAKLKLDSAGLTEHFALGSYGSDHEEREHLSRIALQRARDMWNPSLRPDHTVVIGDTPRDVICGLAVGARTLAVATGSFTRSQLAESGADQVMIDLTETDKIISYLAA
ncbi:MAG: haloacid dehalogenase [Gemmatimonadetes bacterium]|nr:haloacid dehalogenase [Gemmatimonadota bacterium]